MNRAVTSKWSKGSGGPAGDEVLRLVAVFNPTRTLTFDGVDESWQEKAVANALAKPTGTKDPVAVEGGAARRLTPTECARLQGFPDDWFGEPNARPDGPRYEAIGDAVTVNVAEWLGQRIMDVVS